MTAKLRKATYTSTISFLLVRYLLVFSFTISQFRETSADVIDANDKESFVEAGWMGTNDRTKSFDRPGEFRKSLEFLDNTGNGVWVEDFAVEADANDDKRIVYTFRPLDKEYCWISSAQLTIKYYMHHATASVFPCKKGGSGRIEYCSLETPSPRPAGWMTETFQLSISNEIKIDVIVLSGGYIVFDQVIIEHDGDENGDCKTTTEGEGTTNWETTRGTTEEQHNSEGTGIPVTSPPTTTDASATITDPTTTTEELQDPDNTTTENPPSFPSSEDTTTYFTPDDVTTDTDQPTTSPVPISTIETTTDEPFTTETERPTSQASTEIDLPTTTEGFEPCNDTCEYVGIDCHNYYSCINFKYKEFHTCQREQGLAFNPKLRVCDLMENVEECRNCTCEYFPHHDCKNYYYCPDVCNLDLCELRECPSGLLWSIDANRDGKGHQQCTLASNAICAPGTALKNNELLRYIKGGLTNDTEIFINHA